MMEAEGRGRRRIVTALFVGMGLIVYSWALLTVRSLIVNTEWSGVFPYELILNGVFGCFVAVPMGFLFTLGYLVGRACLKYSRRWVAAMMMPLLLGVVILGSGIRHRLDSGVLFKDILECELPAGARNVSHDYDETGLEEHAKVRFQLDRAGIVELMEELRLDPDPTMPSQQFDSVPCTGDWATITVDWLTGEVLLEYLNV